MNTWPDQTGEPCLCAFPPCFSWVGCNPQVAGACPSWCGSEGLCCKQNEAINECDGTHVRPHISFKETYPLWDDLIIIPGSGGATKSAHQCILPVGELSAYPRNTDLIIPQGILFLKEMCGWTSV